MMGRSLNLYRTGVEFENQPKHASATAAAAATNETNVAATSTAAPLWMNVPATATKNSTNGGTAATNASAWAGNTRATITTNPTLMTHEDDTTSCACSSSRTGSDGKNNNPRFDLSSVLRMGSLLGKYCMGGHNTFPLLEEQLQLLQDHFRTRMGQPISMYVCGSTYKSKFGDRCETLRVYIFPASSPPVLNKLCLLEDEVATFDEDKQVTIQLDRVGLEWKEMMPGVQALCFKRQGTTLEKAIEDSCKKKLIAISAPT